jgi:hypothetical protein
LAGASGWLPNEGYGGPTSPSEHDSSRVEMKYKIGTSERGRNQQLVLIFCLWKALLLLLAAFCPGPGYDTSSLILIDTSVQRHNNFDNLSRYDRLALNLFHWDAVYFVKAAQRGQVHEQEWAFSGAYSHLLRLTGQCKQILHVVWLGIDSEQCYQETRRLPCITTSGPGSSFPTSATSFPY